MLIIYANDVDISASVEKNSIKINEKVNNRANTCSFVSLDTEVEYGHEVKIYEAVRLISEASSGQADLIVDDTFEYQEKYKAGDEIILDIEGDEYKHTISSVTHATRTITLTSNLVATLPANTKCGRLIYAGDVINNPSKDLDRVDKIEYKVALAGYSKRFDAKIVVESYEDCYPREIIGRVLYQFVARDTSLQIDDMGAAWTESGVARAMADDTDKKIQGSASQVTGATGAGEAKWTKSFSSMDLSGYDHLRWWMNIASGEGNNIGYIRLRVGTDASNYHEYRSLWYGSTSEDCWNYISHDLRYPDVSLGSPDLSAVEWIQISLTVNNAVAAGRLWFDEIVATTGGFTLENCIRGDSKFNIYNIQYQKPTVVIDEVAKNQNLFWYIDYNRDIHLFESDDTSAPWDIDNSSERYANLVVEADISQIKNRQTVKGGEVAASALRTDIFVADGEQTSFPIPYRFADLKIYVDSGGGYVEKTHGIENIVDEATVDFVSNFQEKTVRNASIATLSDGDKIKFEYYPYQPIRVRAKDNTSIAAMRSLVGGDGIYDGSLIDDQSIETYEEARRRAQAEIDTYKNAILTAKFKTEQDGLKAGQIITITDTNRGLDEDFLIQEVKRSSKMDDRWIYDITCGSSLFGIIEYFQLLYKRSARTNADSEEYVDIIYNIDETVTITPALSYTQKADEFYSCAIEGRKLDFTSMISEADITSSVATGDKLWYVKFKDSETGTVSFDTTTDYNDGNAVKFEADNGGNFKSINMSNVYKIPVNGSTEYTINAWLAIDADLADLGNNGGAKLSVDECHSQYNDSDIKYYYQKWGSLGSGNTNFNEPIGVCVDSNDNIYIADLSNNRVVKYNSEGVYVTKWGTGGTGNGEFNAVWAICCDNNDKIYTTEIGNHRVQRFDTDGTYETKWGTSGSGDGEFNTPTGICADSDNNIFVAEFSNHRIQKFDSDGTYITKWGSNGSGDGQMTQPNGLACDSNDNVYLADYGNTRVQKFDNDGTFITKWSSSFGGLRDLTIDDKDYVYTIEGSNNRIQKFTSGGTYMCTWGSVGSTSGLFNEPWGIAINNKGNIITTETGNDRVQVFSRNYVFEETEQQDFTNYEKVIFTNASTTHLLINMGIYQASGSASIGEIWITPSTSETSTNPASSDMSESA